VEPEGENDGFQFFIRNKSFRMISDLFHFLHE
jgi:hypothetical protein